jgi:tetratricopeptide (TPR) repeat protein
LQLIGEIKGQDEASLRRAIAAEPRSLEVRLALVALLEENHQYAAAMTEAQEAATLAPELAAPVRMLARLQTHLVRYEDAAQTLERLLTLAPNDALAWFEYGQLARYTYALPIGTEDKAFAKAAACAGDDWLLLEMVAQYFLEQLKFPQAAECYDRLFANSPAARDNPVTCRDYARCLKACGRDGEAAKMNDVGLNRCRAMEAVSTGEDLEILRREEALLLHEAGRADDERAVLRSIRDAAGLAGINYTRPEYLPSTPDRLRRLQNIVASRDVVIFLQGPSFADFAARMSEVADIDFAAATLGSFPPVEQQLRQHLGRGADLLGFTHPATVRSWYPELQEFLKRSANNLVLTTYYALSNLAELNSSTEQFVAQHDYHLLFACPARGPPLPCRPLHFEPGNTLSFLLPLLMIGRPRRIFLVGADGGAHPNFKRPYFFYDEIDAEGPEPDFLQRPDLLSYRKLPDRLKEANRRLRFDAVNCDRFVLTSFRFLLHVFDIPIPPIFTVCPHSAHRAFPRIDAETAIGMLRDNSQRRRNSVPGAFGGWRSTML